MKPGRFLSAIACLVLAGCFDPPSAKPVGQVGGLTMVDYEAIEKTSNAPKNNIPVASPEPSDAPETTADEAKFKIPAATEMKIEKIRDGSGAEAIDGKTVVVHYTGRLANGKKFDSSVDKGEPYSFELGAPGHVPGWGEGIRGMKVGEKRRVIIPPEKGYSKKGRLPRVPPDATLNFEIELMEVK